MDRRKRLDGSDTSNIKISIGQVVATSSNVQFNNVNFIVIVYQIGTGSNKVLVFSDGKILGDLNF